MDNRGTGYSSHPSGEMRWTTQRMARDALAVLDHLGWATWNGEFLKGLGTENWDYMYSVYYV